MKNEKGLTIIQLMFLLLAVGIVGALFVDLLIDKRCEGGTSSKLCLNRSQAHVR
jgi:hypothetical protein